MGEIEIEEFKQAADDPTEPGLPRAAGLEMYKGSLSTPSCRDSMCRSSAPRPTSYCYMLTAIACLNSCNLGYDVGSVGGAALLMREQMGWSVLQLGVFVGSINFFSVPGALNAGLVLDWLGRRRTFALSSIIFICGLVGQLLSQSFQGAMAGRVLVGVGVGLGLAIDPLYISEVAPPQFRGHLVSFSEISINIGLLLGFVADAVLLPLPAGLNWRLMLGFGMVMPFILIILTCTVMPESPRWLLMRGRKAEALHILMQTYPPGTDMTLVIQEIEDLIRADAEAHEEGWGAILCPSPPVRLMLLAGVGLAACQQLSGTEALVYFTPEILSAAGFTSRRHTFALTIAIGATKMLFTFISVFQVDGFGRRPLLLTSSAGLCLCLLLMGLLAPHPSLAPLMVGAMCLFMAFFSVAMGPICWVGTAEVFSTSIRAKAMSLATSVNRIISGLVAATCLPLRRGMGDQNYFFMYSVLAAVGGVYLFYFFPETKGRSLEEVEQDFHLRAGRGGLDTSHHHWAEQGSMTPPTPHPQPHTPVPGAGQVALNHAHAKSEEGKEELKRQ